MTQSTEPEAPAEAASDAPTGSPAQPMSTGAAPGTPPNSVLRRVCRLNTIV